MFAVLTRFPHQNLMKALDYFVVGEGDELRLHLVYELHATSLWDAFQARGTGNTPESQVYRGQVLDLVAALTHLHSIGICHGDVTLKNCLLTNSGMLRLADYGTAHSSHGFLLERTEELTTLYARAPERFLGVAASTTAIDMWALGVVSFMLSSRACTWLGLDSVPRILRQLEKLLGPITADSWPDHDRLPLWREMNGKLQGAAGTLQSLAEEGRRAQEGQWLVPVIEVAHRCMKWCPEHRPSSRSLLASMQSVRRESLPQEATFSAPPETAARDVAAGQARSTSRPQHGLDAAEHGLDAAGPGLVAVRQPSHPTDQSSQPASRPACQCSGNCGSPDCKAKLNHRGQLRKICKSKEISAMQNVTTSLCERSCLPGFNLCTLCQCEAMDGDVQCRRGRLGRAGKRFCTAHAAQFQITEKRRTTHYANRHGVHQYGGKWGHELKFAAKCAHILSPWTQPADVDSFVGLLKEACAPAPQKELSAADLHD